MGTRPQTIEEIFPDPPQGLDRATLDLSRVPRHIAIIMDGNGRWAQERGLERGEGHKAGVKAVREAIVTCNDIGVRYLTIYSFSTENWKRPASEVAGLMRLFADTMLKEVDGLNEEGVRVKLLGDVEELPLVTRKVFLQAQRATAQNTGMTLAIAVNYGSRQEILRAVQACVDKAAGAAQAGERVELSEELFEQGLYTAGMPDPDLVIRTSGELRLSNFLLWQVAYSEFYVSNLYWPDFDRYELLRALLSYQGRERRFGEVAG